MSHANDPLDQLHNFGLNVQTREIYIHSFVDNSEEESGIDYRCAVRTIKNLKYLDRLNQKDIYIYLNSCGGDWSQGMAIYDTIVNLKSHITIIGQACVASMSSVIIQAGDLRLLTPNSDFMIHTGDFSFEGTSNQASSTSKWNENTLRTMLNIYIDRCKKGKFFKGWSDTRIRSYLKRQMDKKGDWYLTAEESVDKGFIDGILGVTHEI